MSSSKYQWCSWCYKKTSHRLVKRNYLARNEYKCSSCGNFTVKCRFCSNMATYKPSIKDNEEFFKSFKTNWASELCAEHDGTIADFEKLTLRLEDLKEYRVVFSRSKWNLAKAGKITGGMIAGVAVFCPISYLVAPGIASAIGATGILGAASTGTAISTLSGASLASASLAAIGPGGVYGGIALISATGAALGARKGAVISNNYFGAIKEFKITKVKEGNGPALLFINGFLSQKDQDPSDWIKSVRNKFPSNPYYYVNWESSTNYKMGSLIMKGPSGVAFQKYIKELMKRGSRSIAKKLTSLNFAATISELIGNPWHTSMVKASMTGILLADLIARTNQKEGFILMGNSLGCRVIYYLLNAISSKDKSPIEDVYLLGGAVDRKDKKGWKAALKAVNGKLYNCYSENDSVLKYLYQGANALVSSPIGLGDIEVSDPKLKNVDTTSIVSGHLKYKERFWEILNHIHS